MRLCIMPSNNHSYGFHNKVVVNSKMLQYIESSQKKKKQKSLGHARSRDAFEDLTLGLSSVRKFYFVVYCSILNCAVGCVVVGDC